MGKRTLCMAAAVHVFTASGAICGLFATRAILNHDFEIAFCWLGLALLIDGLDGIFARAVNVGRVLSRFSGERLDLIVDYLTYVFVPVLALLEGGYLVGWPGLFAAGLILLSSLFHFADLDSKAGDNSFVGFPALWNLVAFYIIALALSPVVALMVVAIFVVLTFVPWRWVHPLRVRMARPVTVVVMLGWGVVAAWTIFMGFPATLLQSVLLGVGALYVCGLVAVCHKRWSLDDSYKDGAV